MRSCRALLHKFPRPAFRDKDSAGKVRFDLSACALNCDVFNMSAFADMADRRERLAEGTGGESFQPTNYSKLTDSNNCEFFLVLTDDNSCCFLDSPPCALCESLPAVRHVGERRHVKHVTVQRAST